MSVYMIPDDDYDTAIKHAMLHADLSQIYDMSKEKRNLILPYEDRQKMIRKSCTVGSNAHSIQNRMQFFTTHSVKVQRITHYGILIQSTNSECIFWLWQWQTIDLLPNERLLFVVVKTSDNICAFHLNNSHVYSFRFVESEYVIRDNSLNASYENHRNHIYFTSKTE